MLDYTVLIIVLCIHVLLCAGIYVCMRLRLLMVGRQMMPVVFLVPFWGVICAVLLHLLHVTGQEGTVEVGVEKLHSNEDAYRSFLVEDLNMQRSVVPLQEALILNSASLRRSMMLDVLYENPGDYYELLDEAVTNEDGEIVHYATTAMAELAKEYDFALQQLEKQYADQPDNLRVLADYCDFLREYLGRGIVQGRMEQVQRRQYAFLLAERIKKEPKILHYKHLAQTQMQLGEFALASIVIDEMEQKWPEDEKTLMLRVEYMARQGEGDTLKALIKRLQGSGLYLSVEAREQLSFFESGCLLEGREAL